MKILLVNPTNSLQLSTSQYRKYVQLPIPPLGLACLAAVAKRKGHEVVIVDQFLYAWDNEKLISKVKAGKYDLIGITCLTPSDRILRDIGEKLRLIGFEGHIILGNTHASIFADNLLKSGNFDAVVHGEGEVTFSEILDAVERKETFENIDGLSYLLDGKPVKTATRNQIQNADDLPFPAWEKLDLFKYDYYPFFGIYKPYTVIQASRGCPNNCYFCTHDNQFKKYRIKSVARVLEETKICVKHFGFEEIGYIDSYFPPNNRWGWEFVDGVKREFKDSPFKFSIQTRVDSVDEKLLSEMADLGAKNIMIGFESGNPETLERIGKKTTAEQGREAMKILKRIKVTTTGFFMIGFPWETEPMMKQTVNYALELQPDLLRFNIAVPLPGSQFFEDIKNNESLENELDYNRLTAWTEFSEGRLKAEQNFSKVPIKTLLRIQRNGMLKHFFNIKVLWRLALFGIFRPRNVIGLIFISLQFLKGKFSFTNDDKF